MTESAITIYDRFESLQKAAVALYQSKYFSDVTSEAQAIVKIMAGGEIGIPPFASMTGIHIIQGKPVLGSNVLATLVKNDYRYDYRIKEATNEICTLQWFEDGKPVGESSFTIQEAQAAGLTSKDNWKKWPSDMLFARAISRGARRYAPGIFGGTPVYTPDEMNVDTDEEGNIVPPTADIPEGVVKELPTEPEPAKSNGKMTLEDAKAITNSRGIPYGELDVQTLSNMYNALVKTLKGELPDDERQTKEQKKQAIEVIMASLNG